MLVKSSDILRRCVVILGVLVLYLDLPAAGDKRNKVTVSGGVYLVDQNTLTIMVDTRNGGRRLVIWNQDTKFKYGRGGKASSSWQQVKEAQYISCLGTLDEKLRLVADECVHREPGQSKASMPPIIATQSR